MVLKAETQRSEAESSSGETQIEKLQSKLQPLALTDSESTLQPPATPLLEHPVGQNALPTTDSPMLQPTSRNLQQRLPPTPTTPMTSSTTSTMNQTSVPTIQHQSPTKNTSMSQPQTPLQLQQATSTTAVHDPNAEPVLPIGAVSQPKRPGTTTSTEVRITDNRLILTDNRLILIAQEPADPSRSSLPRYAISAAICTPPDWPDLIPDSPRKAGLYLYQNIEWAPKGPEVSFMLSPHGWPVATLQVRISGDFMDPVYHAADLFAWYARSIMQHSLMQQSAQRTNLRKTLLACRAWAKNEGGRLSAAWQTGQGVNVNTVCLTKCLRLLLMIGQRIVYSSHAQNAVVELHRLVWEFNDLDAISPRILGPTRVILEGSEEYGPWVESFHLGQLDSVISVKLLCDEKTESEFFP
ncbi:hypothetical protein EG329_003758 [Mollisiaceae sp. DMI_Dod_QoI]|nr:hypothetical protein EG329_003758 [Helotiales sp. DMI_Dod_QoI]